jgi:hypothetical protein
VQVREANGRLSLEGEFVVAPELDRRALELRPLHPGIAGRMVDVGRKTLFVQGAGDVDVAAHRIMRDPVRWSDLPLAGWPAKRCDDAKASAEYLARRAFDANDPATLEWDLAVEFASALGARLAAGCELAVALRDANVEFPGRGTDFVGELCSAAIVDDGIFTFRYEGQSPHHKLRYPFIEGHKSERPRFLTFRLALSAAE